MDEQHRADRFVLFRLGRQIQIIFQILLRIIDDIGDDGAVAFFPVFQIIGVLQFLMDDDRRRDAAGTSQKKDNSENGLPMPD